MKFENAIQDDAVVEALQSIEDKLRERGFLVTATGDSESDVTISFKTVSHQGEEGPHLVIAINSRGSADPDSPAWEEISDYVNEKYSDLRDELSAEVQEALDDSHGQIVTLNGKVVY